MSLVYSEEDLAAQACVRAVFDPAGLLNPHKVLPEGARCAELAMLQGMDAAKAAADMPEGSWI